jgi:hypothetical protein
VFKVSLNLGKIYKNTFSSQILVNQYQLINSQFRDYLMIVYYSCLLFCDFDKLKYSGNINTMSFMMELLYGSFSINAQVKYQDKMKNAAAVIYLI